MSYDDSRHAGRLSRLAPDFYRGRSFVHWTMTVENRATGWLDDLHHARMREWMAHALGRFKLMCPAYCLMPDHAHFIWLGWSEASDQKGAAALLRRAWNMELRQSGRSLQRQPFDHVLREDERARGAFAAACQYVGENPTRAGLVPEWRAWRFSGAVVPGYPWLNPREEEFWPRFWWIYGELSEGKGG